MIMKKNLMLAGLMMVSTIIFAQHHKGDRSDRAAKGAEKMKTELSLSDDQYAKVKVINEKYASSYSKLRSDTTLTVGTSHKRMKQLRDDQQTQIKSVLTKDQLTKWTAMKTKRDEDRKNHKRGKGHGSKSDKG
jgi:periplasmic protein CpxP/Spy